MGQAGRSACRLRVPKREQEVAGSDHVSQTGYGHPA